LGAGKRNDFRVKNPRQIVKIFEELDRKAVVAKLAQPALIAYYVIPTKTGRAYSTD
jgi:hypothetical protein